MKFTCKIKNLDAYLLILHNGVFDQKSIRHFAPPKGVKIIPCRDTRPCVSTENTGNFRIEITPNTIVEKPLQLINVIDTVEPLDVVHAFEIVVGQGSSLSLIHCDESMNNVKNTIQTNVSIELKSHSSLQYYNLQNINNHSTLNNQTEVKQHEHSRLISHTYTLNGKILNKHQHIDFTEEYANSDVQGLYLLDKNQDCFHRIRLNHNQPNGRSNQLFKGILDDSARAHFEGYVFVEKHAQKTEALQNNKNLLLTDKANVQTHPFLEIYADDVKCSHGATIGQLDEDALFYSRTRGIPEKQAKTLLMYAFAHDVVRNVHLEPLREYLENLIKRRLNGENITCENCVFSCVR
ncbi:MAG: Fe-S cluster assembly protein SufD [Bacteroidales bacterium]|jgi:Fe-S cluster assembly protein SufD|nr:Fe-S cluster assembly protein SufD [Bacteroidales bacterium]